MEKHTLRKQINNKGLYVSLTYQLNYNEEKHSNLIFSYEAHKLWETPCKLGAMIFFDYFSRKFKGELNVKIIELDWLPVDTNNLIVLFATIEGLSELLGFKIEKLELDLINESFVFPEQRTL